MAIVIESVPASWILARSLIASLQAPARPRSSRFAESTATARILQVTPDEYLADPCATPSLSSGIAHAIVAESPLHAWTQHPRLGGSANGAAGTKAMNDGALIHRLMLGKGKDLVLVDAPDFRTTAAREERDAAFAAGKIPILQHHFAEKAAIAAKLRDACVALGYAFDGESELAVEWVDECADGPVLCRSMFDHVHVDRGIILDIKTTGNANPRQISRTFVEYGYDIQWAAYTRALARLRPELEGRIDFTFLFLELEPPYSVVPAKPDGALREIGSLRWNRAVQIWRDCLAAGKWPGYTDGSPVMLEAAPWDITRELGTWQQ